MTKWILKSYAAGIVADYAGTATKNWHRCASGPMLRRSGTFDRRNVYTEEGETPVRVRFACPTIKTVIFRRARGTGSHAAPCPCFLHRKVPADLER